MSSRTTTIFWPSGPLFLVDAFEGFFCDYFMQVLLRYTTRCEACLTELSGMLSFEKGSGSLLESPRKGR